METTVMHQVHEILSERFGSLARPLDADTQFVDLPSEHPYAVSLCLANEQVLDIACPVAVGGRVEVSGPVAAFLLREQSDFAQVSYSVVGDMLLARHYVPLGSGELSRSHVGNATILVARIAEQTAGTLTAAGYLSLADAA